MAFPPANTNPAKAIKSLFCCMFDPLNMVRLFRLLC
jgi:hypothetical protein